MTMSVEIALARVAELQAALRPARPPAELNAAPAASVGSAAPSFASALTAASTPSGGAGAIVAAAQAEVGEKEQPPGSNDSARITQYRTAVPGSVVGPWCAYFASWASAQAGTPLGDRGQGFARVDDVWAWGQRTGRTLPASSTPQPGDLIIWDEHMGIVEKALPDGSIQTIEGNSSDQVSRRVHRPGGDGAVGYVRPGPVSVGAAR